MDGLLQKSLMAAAALAIGVGAWISGARAEGVTLRPEVPASVVGQALDARSDTKLVAGNP